MKGANHELLSHRRTANAQSNVRKFLDSEIAPVVDQHEKKGPLTKTEATAFINQLMPFGYFLGFLPEDCGGSNLEAKTNGILVEELGRVWASLAGRSSSPPASSGS